MMLEHVDSLNSKKFNIDQFIIKQIEIKIKMIKIDIYFLSQLLIMNSNYSNKNACMLRILLNNSKNKGNHEF